MKFLYKGLFALNATSLMIFVYMVKCEYWIGGLGRWSVILYVLLLLIYTWICIALRAVLKSGDDGNEIKEVYIVTDGYVSIYLGYIFVSLSIPENDWVLFGVIFFAINIFLYNSQTISFNPLLCLFGYNYYEVHTASGTRAYVITRKKNIKGTSELEFTALKKINEFTYIDEEKRDGLFVGKSKGSNKSV